MRFLLDTNTCIRFLNGRSATLVKHLTDAADEDVGVCSVVKAEMLYGSERSKNPLRSREIQQRFFARYVSLPFDDPAAEGYAKTRAVLEQSGTPIGANDLLIAAIALANGLTLITHNTDEFRRVPGLKVEDWETSP